jgi:hypothetical protein
MTSSLLIVAVLLTAVLLQLTFAEECPCGQRFINGVCLQPCSKVCRDIKLPCEPFLDDAPDPDISAWLAAESVPCFQRERDQTTGERFLRTSCKCPDRTYGADNPGDLSNCILSEITDETINFGQLYRVQLGMVRATDGDIDFEGDAERSLICKVDASSDVEFETTIKFSYNVITMIVCGDDFEIEQGSIVGPFNVFSTLVIGDEFAWGYEDIDEPAKVFKNTWGDITAAECDIESDVQPIIMDNVCNSAIFGDMPSCLISPIIEGFSCIGG